MTRGRKPKAREVQISEGRHLKNPKRFENEVPATSPDEPIKPEHLDGYADNAWQHIEQVMRAAGMWSVTYQVTIELFCESYANYLSTIDAVKELGHAIKAGTAADGTPIYRRNPVAVELHKYKEETIKLLTELGLTPSARSRVSLPTDTDSGDDFLQLLA